MPGTTWWTLAAWCAAAIAAIAARCPTVRAAKDSSGDIGRIGRMAAMTASGDLPPGFAPCVGLDDGALDGALSGAVGWVAGLVNALPAESVRLWECARRAALGRCGKPGVAGRVVLRLAVAADGKLTSVKVKESQLEAPAVETCLVDAVRGASFPAADGETVVLLPVSVDGAAVRTAL